MKRRFINRLVQDVEETASYVMVSKLASWRNIFSINKPSVINFQVNDICNAKCVHCNVWSKKWAGEITSEGLADLLRDPFFFEVERVGITGGEPTLKSNLPEYYRAIAASLPRLSVASFITNGLLPERAIHMYSEINQEYQARGLFFGGMVSLDGMGEVHDKVRGISGSFTKAIRSLFGLRDRNISVSACCTIVKDNVYGLHDLLEWGKEKEVYIRFRVADFIKRLYNENLLYQIRNFNGHEIKHLVSFFHLLLTEYEPDEQIKKTYTSILSLLTGGKRLIQCPYQSCQAINIDCRGMFACCAPKGTPHPLEPDAERSVTKHKLERVWIRLKNCSHCIHDYHADWTPVQARLVDSVPRFDQIMYGFTDQDFPEHETPSQTVSISNLKKILLVGWYGTETAGDIAILSGIIEEYLEKNSQLEFILFSLYPYYTRITVSEIGPRLSSRLQVLPYHGTLASQAVDECDAIVMAGGPLMDIPQTGLIASLFLLFYKQNKYRIVERCGIGPLHVEEYRRNVMRIIMMANQVSVRDQASRRLLQSLGIMKEIQVINDPSQTFVARTKIAHTHRKSRIIRCFFRELTTEYPQATTLPDATRKIKLFLSRLLEWYPRHRIELWSMHYFPIGNDDRLYAKKLAGDMCSERIVVDYKPRSPEEILHAMAVAHFCVCMRFHSVVFAATIGAPFVAIDYTAGGKVQGYLDDTHQSFKSVSLEGLDHIEKSRLDAILRGSQTEK